MNLTADPTDTPLTDAVVAPASNLSDGVAPLPAVASGAGLTEKQRGSFDTFLAGARDRSPAWVVNNGTRFSLGLRAAADGMSVWSSIRVGSKSPLRFWASILTLGTELMGVVFPERKVSEEKQEDYARMSKGKYFVTKTLEALNPKQHVMETAGLATILNGVLTAGSGIKQSVRTRVSWEIAQGVMTAMAGMVITYMPDRERAWQIAQGIFFARAPAAAVQAHHAYYVGVPEKNVAKGDWQQAAKWVLNQVANMFGMVYGGVKKLPDGSIMHIGKKGEDITLPNQSRRAVVVMPTIEGQTHKENAMPETVISNVNQLERVVSAGQSAIVQAG